MLRKLFFLKSRISRKASGLDLEQHGTRIILIAVGLIGDRRKTDFDLIKALQHRGVKWNKVIFDIGDFEEPWLVDSEVDRADLLHLAIRRHCSVETIRYLLDERVQMHSRPYHLDEANKEADPAWPEVLELSVRTRMHHADEIYRDMRLYHYFKQLGAMPPDPTDPIKARRRLGLIPDLIWSRAKNETVADIWNNGDGFEMLYDEDRDRILIKTIRSGDLTWARTLIERGASVNGQTIFDTRLYTPLQQACDNKSPLWFIRYLIGKGGNTTFDEDTGYTALHFAAEEGWLNLASLSLDNHTDINANCTPNRDEYVDDWFLTFQDEDGQGELLQLDFTPLDLSSAYGRLDVVKFLLNLGGESAVPGETGFYGALNLAEDNNFQGVVMLLEQESEKQGEICEELQ
ncbi:hypothetical protein PG988_014235 [Apiospora saccharicola]